MQLGKKKYRNAKKILVLCPYPKSIAAGQRLKYEQYFPRFESEGYRITVSPFMTKQFYRIVHKEGYYFQKILWTLWGYCLRIRDLFRIPFFDGIYVFLWITPIGFPIFESLVKFLNKKLIYDIDDFIFLSFTGENSRRFTEKIKGKQKPIYLIKNAGYVIVCTPSLKEYAEKLNSNVIDISSTFDTDYFKPVTHYNSNKTITIGWTGTFSTLPMLNLLDDVLRKIAQQRSIKLLIICNKKHEIKGVTCEYRNWKKESEIDDLHDMDIGLYPIPQNEWSLGKSSLKALTYMSCGIPVVATAYGTNFRVIKHEKSGFLVNSEEEWIDTLIHLIDSPSLRKKIGQMGRKRVEQLFSVKVNAEKYLNTFASVYGKP